MSDNQPPTINVPPGWYPDQTGNQRWWDGTQWGVYAPAPTTRFSGVAIAGMILGILAILGSYVTGAVLLAAAGMLCSGLGLTNTKGGAMRGRGFAITGWICSGVAVIAVVAFWVQQNRFGL
jgi:hypothetical protein